MKITMGYNMHKIKELMMHFRSVTAFAVNCQSKHKTIMGPSCNHSDATCDLFASTPWCKQTQLMTASTNDQMLSNCATYVVRVGEFLSSLGKG